MLVPENYESLFTNVQYWAEIQWQHLMNDIFNKSELDSPWNAQYSSLELLLPLFVFNPLNFNIITNQLVHISDNSGALDIHQDERWDDSTFQRVVGSCCRPWVNIELAFMLICFELVGMACDKDVHIQLSLYHGKCFRFAPWNHLVAMAQANAELTHSHHFLLRVDQILIEVSPDDMDVTGQGLEIVMRLFGTEVSSAEDMLDTARNQQFLELGGEAVASVGNVQVTQDQH